MIPSDAIVSARVGSFPDGLVDPGSAQHPCESCGQQVWLSLYSQDVLARAPLTRVLCTVCAWLESRFSPS